jgi:predicted adenylyl cyclase CyaB
VEIEAKVKVKDPPRLRARLQSTGAVFFGRMLERNWLYDHPERLLARADKLLRLRQDRRVSLTFKGPRERSKYKKREEIEMEFPDYPSVHSFLESVGMVKWFYYEKFRETWKLASSEIVLDELPHLGFFAEVEAPTETEIDEVIKRLKLPRDYINRTYVEMLTELSNNRGEKRVLEFRFPPQHESAPAADDDGSIWSARNP